MTNKYNSKLLLFLLTLELLESCACFYNYFCCCFFRFCFSSLNQWCLKPLEFARIVSLYFHCYCSILFSFPSSWILLLICFCFCHCCHFFIVFLFPFFKAPQFCDSTKSWCPPGLLCAQLGTRGKAEKKTISGIISRADLRFCVFDFCLSELFVFWSGPGARLQGRAWWSCLPQGCACSSEYDYDDYDYDLKTPRHRRRVNYSHLLHFNYIIPTLKFPCELQGHHEFSPNNDEHKSI